MQLKSLRGLINLLLKGFISANANKVPKEAAETIFFKEKRIAYLQAYLNKISEANPNISDDEEISYISFVNSLENKNDQFLFEKPKNDNDTIGHLFVKFRDAPVNLNRKPRTTINPKSNLTDSHASSSFSVVPDNEIYSMLSHCDWYSRIKTGETSLTFYQKSITYDVWKRDLIKLGINRQLLEKVKKDIVNFKNLYVRMMHLPSTQVVAISEPWELICISGDLDKIKQFRARDKNFLSEKTRSGIRPIEYVILSGNLAAFKFFEEDLLVSTISHLFYAILSQSLDMFDAIIERHKYDRSNFTTQSVKIPAITYSSVIGVSTFELAAYINPKMFKRLWTLYGELKGYEDPGTYLSTFKYGPLLMSLAGKHFKEVFNLVLPCYPVTYEEVKNGTLNNLSLILKPEMFHVAARTGDIKVFEFLRLNIGLSLNCLDSNNKDLLYSAIISKNLKLIEHVQALFASYKNVSQPCVGIFPYTYIKAAIKTGNLEVLKHLFKHPTDIFREILKADIFRERLSRAIPIELLGAALQHGHGDIAEYLLSMKGYFVLLWDSAGRFIPDKHLGANCIMLAKERQAYYAYVKTSDNEIKSIKIEEILFRNFQVLKHKVDVLTEEQNTLLKDLHERVICLMEQANLIKKDNCLFDLDFCIAQIPKLLVSAAQHDSLKVVKQVARPENLTQRNDQNLNILQISALFGYSDIMKFAIASGLKPEVDAQGDNLFHLATLSDDIATLKYVRDVLKVPIDKPNGAGHSALEIAIMRRNFNALTFCLQAGLMVDDAKLKAAQRTLSSHEKAHINNIISQFKANSKPKEIEPKAKEQEPLNELQTATKLGMTETMLMYGSRQKPKSLLTPISARNLFHWVMYSNIREAMEIVANDFDIPMDTTDALGLTALEIAIEEGKKHSIAFCIEKGLMVSEEKIAAALKRAHEKGHSVKEIQETIKTAMLEREALDNRNKRQKC